MNNPFAFYAGMARPDTTQSRQKLAEELQAKIMGQPMPQNAREGVGALMTGIAAGAAKIGCPVSKALTGVEITLDAALES